MSRSVPEWIGKTDDTKVPRNVALRVFDAHQGRDYITGQKIMPGMKWECDHKIALINGGQNRESNLGPVLSKTHKAKTARDIAEKAKVERVRQKHLGLRKRSSFATSRDGPYKQKVGGQTVPRRPA